MSADAASPSGAGAYPDLHALMARAGGYAAITPVMWAEFDAAAAAWLRRYRESLPRRK